MDIQTGHKSRFRGSVKEQRFSPFLKHRTPVCGRWHVLCCKTAAFIEES